jgi:hypothetical protein
MLPSTVPVVSAVQSSRDPFAIQALEHVPFVADLDRATAWSVALGTSSPGRSPTAPLAVPTPQKVNQLDAEQLDSELGTMLRMQFMGIFKVCHAMLTCTFVCVACPRSLARVLFAWVITVTVCGACVYVCISSTLEVTR